MNSRRILVFVVLIATLIVVIAAWIVLNDRNEPESTSSQVALDCCQCTALGQDQYYPFPKVPGSTCEEYCFQGCLERGQSELACKIGSVGGYALACPDVLMPTATPFGE